MKVLYEKQFKLSTSDQLRLRKLVPISVRTFITRDHTKSRNDFIENDRMYKEYWKFCNMLEHESLITERMMNKILLLLDNVKNEINNRVKFLNDEYPIDGLPDQFEDKKISFSIRPKEMVETLQQQYRIHLMNIDDIVDILKTESFDDEEEFSETSTTETDEELNDY